ncbi:C25 family cysteine peptidase [Bacteroidota bacterium]
MKYLTVIFAAIFIGIFWQNKISAQEIDNLQISETGFSFNINIKPPAFKISKVGKFIQRDYYEFSGESRSGLKIPYKNIIVVLPPNSEPEIEALYKNKTTSPNTIVASADNGEKVSPKARETDIINFQNSRHPEVPLVEVERYFWWRDYYCAKVRINFMDFDPGTMSLVEYNDIEIKVNFGTRVNISEESPIILGDEFDRLIRSSVVNADFAGQFSGPHIFSSEDEFDDWIDYAKTYIKIGTDSDDIFRLSGSDLTDLGINISEIDPSTLQLFESGELYPLYVSGSGDGIFDPDDYVEFYGHKNYNDLSYREPNQYGEEYVEYLNRYSDMTFFYLTWGGVETNFTNEKSTSLTGINDTLKYYTHFEHVEQNLMYQPGSVSLWRNQEPDWTETNSWYWGWTGSGSDRSFSFSVEDKRPDSESNYFFKLFSAGSSEPINSHNILLKVNQVVIDSQVVDRNDIVVLNGELNSDLLNEGNNIIAVRNIDNGTTANSFGYDWYEVEYEKLLKAENDSLTFQFKSEMETDLRIIRVTGVQSTNFVLYKVEPEITKIGNYTIVGDTLLFADTVSQNDKFVLVKEDDITRPELYEKKEFVNLRDSQRQNDYLIITHKDLEPGVVNYNAFINSNYEVNSDYVFVSDIFDEFNYGYPDPVSIRSFLMSAYDNWQSPKVTYVMIIGSACYDFKQYTPDEHYINKNLIPSYGEPVSDTWFTIWDEISLIPQLYIGRIPVINNEQTEYYLNKHTEYLEQEYTNFNKRAMFFSGGISEYEFNFFKTLNDQVIADYINVDPYKLHGTHFYKTAAPPTNFGPYTEEYIANEIDEGAIIISYIGHSGTEIWDNSIINYDQLDNQYDKYPLITDFGCSTGKFAQPDIFCFGANFTNQGSSITYIGNSALGSYSSAEFGSENFYDALLGDETSIPTTSQAHVLAKINYNSRIFTLTSTLFGDPIIALKIPQQPNLIISENDIIIENSTPSDDLDSLLVRLVINNFGSHSSDSLNIQLTDMYGDTEVFSFNKRIPLPEYIDTLNVQLPINNLPGNHLISAKLDLDDEIDEIYENDNQFLKEIYVSSKQIKILEYQNFYASHKDNLIILNSTVDPGLIDNNLLTKFTSHDSSQIDWIISEIDTFYTKVNLESIPKNERYWVKSGFTTNDTIWTTEKSMYIGDTLRKYFLADSFSFSYQPLTKVHYENEGIEIKNDTLLVNILSTGYPLLSGHVNINGEPTTNQSFGWGMGITILDGESYKVEHADFYNYPEVPAKADELSAVIEAVEPGKLVIMNVYHDGRWYFPDRLVTAIETLGSNLISQLPPTAAWILIGSKNMNPDNVFEIMGDGGWDGDSLSVDTTFIRYNPSGSFTTETVGPVASWSNLEIEYLLPDSSAIEIYPIVSSAQESDTLSMLELNDGVADLGFLDEINKSAKFLVKLISSPAKETPNISRMSIDYTGVPELGTNYQVAWADRDSLDQGENINLSFYVYNVGESVADSFNVKVEIVNSDNSREQIFETLVDSLGVEQRKLFDVNYISGPPGGDKSFLISIDSDEDIPEVFEDNNFYSIPFHINADTTHPTLNLTFDGVDIFDGDYISHDPVIRIELSDDALFDVADTSAVQLFINNEPIYYSQNMDIISYSVTEANPKVTIEYRPHFDEGEYTLRVIGRDPVGNLVDPAGVSKSFIVEDEAKLLYVYNYPNPFKYDTYFTFKLTQVPDELKIKIYTVAGRLIKEIERISSDLNFDFNRIYWDGRDEDGDLLANGVYIYKVIMTKDGQTESINQKLAILR